MSKLLGIAVILILVSMWLICIQYQSSIINNLISGFWVADSSFCQEADVDMFQIYFSPDASFGSRACYILAKRDSELVLNEPTSAQIALEWFRTSNWSLSMNVPKFLAVRFMGLSDECSEEFPAKQQMRLYPMTGKMVLYHGDVITAVLYKDSINTELESIIQEKTT